MPLRARQDGKDVFAFEFDHSTWLEFKEHCKHTELLMPCCHSRAIPKTSKLGNFFFSHKEKGDCIFEAESQEHLFLKGVIAQAAIKAGWETTTEKSGESPNGERWIADVYCSKGSAKVVFEVQLSKQSKVEMLKRQERYKQSGVRCAWIIAEKAFTDYSFVSNKEVPFFKIDVLKVGVIPKVREFETSLSDFIDGALNGALVWKEKFRRYKILYINDICWSCHESNKQVCGYKVNWYINLAEPEDNASVVFKGILDRIISSDNLMRLGLNFISKVEKLNGRADVSFYCNHCLHCGEAQSNYHLVQKINENRTGFSIVEHVSSTPLLGHWEHEE